MPLGYGDISVDECRSKFNIRQSRHVFMFDGCHYSSNELLIILLNIILPGPYCAYGKNNPVAAYFDPLVIGTWFETVN